MKVKILDLIDFEKVDVLLEGFNKTTGFVTAILDLEGNVLSKSGWRQMCTHFHRINPETAKKCTVSDTELANKMAEGEKYHFYKCLNGLVDVAVPIVINGEHIANLFSGQFFFEEPDRAFFTKQAEKFGFDENKYMEALVKVPVVSKEEVKTAMDFLLNMTQLISEMTFHKLGLIELNKTILESEKKFKSVFESANVGKSITSLTGEINVNETLLQMLGYTREEFQNKKWQDITPEDEIPFIENIFRQLQIGEIESARFEKRDICKNGSYIWVDVSVSTLPNEYGQPLYLIATIIDITERKQVEIALQASKDYLDKIINSVASPIFVKDEKHNFRLVNDALCKLLNLTPEDLIGNTGLEHFPDDQKEVFLTKDKEVLNTGKENINEELLTDGRGNIRTIITKKSSYTDNDGNKFLVGVINDITERKKAEEKLLASQAKLSETLEMSNRARQSLLSVLEDQRRTQQEINTLNAELEHRVELRTEQLEAANKELEAFSYSVSHDLRAPLRHINGFISLFLESKSTQLTEEELGFLNTVTNSASEMGKLIDALLSFSKLNQTELRKTKIDTMQVIQFGLKLFEQEIAERAINIQINPLPKTSGDYQLIGQIWTNLISNAIKYTRKTEKPEIEIGSYTENDFTIFFIKDNGTGFNMKYVDKLFKVFQRLHKPRDFEGIGIGLANVNRIINRHGGRCWAVGELEKGATFYFSLPND